MFTIKMSILFEISFALPGFSGSPIYNIDTDYVEGIAACVVGNNTFEEQLNMLYDSKNSCVLYDKNRDDDAGIGIVTRTTRIGRYPLIQFYDETEKVPLPENPPF